MFDGLNDVDEATARRRCEERVFGPEEVVLKAGSPASGVLLVLSGALVIEVEGIEVGRAHAGDVVGEMALFTEGTRTANVFSVEQTKVLTLTREGYEELRDTMHPVAMNLERHALAAQIGHLRRVSERITELSDGTDASVSVPRKAFFASVRSLFGMGGGADLPSLERNRALRRSSLFGDVPDEALAFIAKRMSARAHEAGHFLCTEGKAGNEMYVVASGEVEVVCAIDGTRVHRLATLGEGSAFGLLALAHDRPRMASCVARSKVVVLVLDRAGYEALSEGPYLDASAFRRAMLRALSDQLAKANDEVARYEHATGEYRDIRPLLQAAGAVA